MKHRTASSSVIIITLILIQVCSFAQTRNSVSGKVFNDLNHNGILDEDELGIAGVPVSNQLDFELTDAEGSYSLPVEENSIVFISKPGGFSVPLNENNLPQFYYLHVPEGSPEGLDYLGVTPTGVLPESLDFAQYAIDQ